MREVLDGYLPGAVPADLVRHFRFFEDGKTGDFRRFHLYLYFTRDDRARTEGDFHTTWPITDTLLAIEGDGAAELVEEQRRVNEELLRLHIVERLRQETTCLRERGGQLVKMSAIQRG